jgi:hypothetical protein
MKGVVFTEFLEMVESQNSALYAQSIIEESRLASGGAYTAVGTYPESEMAALVGALSRRSGVAPGELLRQFGRHLFARFSELYPSLFGEAEDAFSFLASVETKIHVNVKKLYPDASLPRFEVVEQSADLFRIIYRSERHLEDLCEGLIEGCLAHFGERAQIERRVLARAPAAIVEFRLTRMRA